jgi:hypothetical protein
MRGSSVSVPIDAKLTSDQTIKYHKRELLTCASMEPPGTLRPPSSLDSVRGEPSESLQLSLKGEMKEVVGRWLFPTILSNILGQMT